MIKEDIQVTYVDHMGSDLSVVNAARVSFAKESKEFVEQDAKLINYLATHKHFSPFNHSFLTVRVKAPIFVARQLVKHEYMPWNEVSRRYVDEEPAFYIPNIVRAKADNVKQGSSNESVGDNADKVMCMIMSAQAALNDYNWLLNCGVCPEQARMVLPQNTMTEWIWSGSLKAFAKMLQLRLDPHTQYETRLVAEKIKPIIEERFPVSLPALLRSSL